MAPSLIATILYLPLTECLVSQIPNRFLHRSILNKPSPAVITTSTRLFFSEFNESTELLEALLPPQKSESTRLTNDAFQRMRLGEQLRLNRRHTEQPMSAGDVGESQNVSFQRARLAEQLRLEKKRGADPRDVSIVSEGAQTSADSHDVNSLQIQLAKLHQIVKEATASSSEVPAFAAGTAPSQNTTSSLVLMKKNAASNKNNPSNTISSLVDFVSTTHLPLAPREDASLLSLALAPLAHLTSAFFLLCASAFYAIMAPLDVICNDEKTNACLYGGGNVCKSCWSCVFTSVTRDSATQIFYRAIEVVRTSLLAIWCVTKCVGIRARQSKYANECLDAATGCLRYVVYAVRSMQFLWRDVLKRLYPWRNNSHKTIRMSLGPKRKKLTRKKGLLHAWRRKFHLYSILLSIKNARTQRLYRQQSLQLEQRQLRLEKEYQEKFFAVNQERIALERDRRNVQNAQRDIEEERRRLMIEGLNVMACYASMSADDSSSSKLEDGVGQKRSGWGFGNWWKAWD